MSKPVVEVQVRAVVATSGGCAVFLGNEDKVFVMFVDQSVGRAIMMFKQGTQKERPLTHDLLAIILRALGAKRKAHGGHRTRARSGAEQEKTAARRHAPRLHSHRLARFARKK